jgi:hypothetical protein
MALSQELGRTHSAPLVSQFQNQRGSAANRRGRAREPLSLNQRFNLWLIPPNGLKLHRTPRPTTSPLSSIRDGQRVNHWRRGCRRPFIRRGGVGPGQQTLRGFLRQLEAAAPARSPPMTTDWHQPDAFGPLTLAAVEVAYLISTHKTGRQSPVMKGTVTLVT